MAIHQKREADVANKKTAADSIFTAQGATIESVPKFKDLRRILSNNDSDESAMYWSLKRARITRGPEVLAQGDSNILQSRCPISAALRLRVMGTVRFHDEQVAMPCIEPTRLANWIT
jgi:hypothetical protein